MPEVKKDDEIYFLAHRCGSGSASHVALTTKCAACDLEAAEETARVLTEALEWALDLLDMYDKRLAEEDGEEKIYAPIHMAAKAKARAALRQAGVREP